MFLAMLVAVSAKTSDNFSAVQRALSSYVAIDVKFSFPNTIGSERLERRFLTISI